MSKQAVKLLAQGLSVGEDSGFVPCPFCHAEHEQKFSVSRLDTGLIYNCFRASCGASGFISTGYWEADYGEKPVRPKRRPYTGELHEYTAEDTAFFREAWDIEPTGFMVTDRDEYALPILGPTGFRKGWVIRQPRWKSAPECARTGNPNPDYPKALTYKDEPDHSKLSWGRKTRGDMEHIVLVEDILSAWKITQHTNHIGVALQGTTLGYEEVKEIGRERPLSVTIWLDPDATNAAYKIQHKWGLSFNQCSVITSDADPKDIAPEVLREKLDARWQGD